MGRALGLAALRFLGVVIVAITFAFFVERLMPAHAPDGRPLPEEYLGYWADLLTRSVAARIGNALPWSVAIISVASVIAFGVGTVMGVWMARPGRRRLGQLASLLVTVIATIPAFLIGMILVAVLSQRLRWLPPALGFSPTQLWQNAGAVALDVGSHAFLPILTLSLAGIGVFALAARGATVGILESDHVLYAHALGLPDRRIFWAHEARLAMIPVVTGLGISLGVVVAGALLVEATLSYPGIGWMLYLAIQGGDLPMMRGIMLVLIVVLALTTTLVDLLLPRLDPRIRR